MEHSTAENARSAGLARLHEMVMEVKADREVGLAYMKSLEIEKRIKAEGKAEGRAEGRAEGILVLLSAKGTVPPEVEKAIYAQTDMDTLNQWLLLAAGAGSVEEFVDGMCLGTGQRPKRVE